MSLDHAFYVNPNLIHDGHFSLDENESHHALHVLRFQIGNTIRLLDGIGTGYIGEITEKEGVVKGIIKEQIPHFGENKIPIHLAIGLIKKDRFELALEKVTELGVQSITPLLLDRCIKRSINMERSQKRVVTAAKQCQRSVFPKVHELISLEQWFDKVKNQTIIGCLIGSDYTIEQTISRDQTDSVHILIGPEGDFSESELRTIMENQVKQVSLGLRRLRAETAAMTAIANVNSLINQ